MEKRVRTIPYDVESEESHVSMPPPVEPAGTGSEDRLLDLARLLWNQRRVLRKFALWAGGITMVLSLFMHNTYRSTTRLMPPDDQGGSKASLAMMAGLASKVTGGSGGGGGSDLGMLAGDLLGAHNTGELFIGVLHSRTAQESIVDRFDLTSVYGMPWLHIRAQRDDACKELESNTEASQDKKSGIMAISVTDKDPKRAAALANGYVDELNRLIASVSTSAAGRERQFLEQRLVEVKKDLDEATAQLSQFSSKNTTFDPTVQGKATVEAVAGLEGELIAAESQLRGLQAIYTPENVRVRSLQARVTELKKQLGSLSGSTDVDTVDSTSPNSPSEMPFPSLRKLPLLGATYADLFRRSRIEEVVYQVLTQQYELAKVQEAKETPTVKVLDHGEVPVKKWGPHRGILTIIGTILGLLVGSLIVIGTDRWERWDPNEPRKVFLSDLYEHIQRHRVVRGIRATFRKAPLRFNAKSDEWHNGGSR
jgi:capsule polysaccharide export protein KpsE/RkpR